MASFINTSQAQFTRPDDGNAYTSGDVISNDTTAGVALKFSNTRGTLTRVRFVKSGTTTTNATFKLFLLGNDPGIVNDNASLAFASPAPNLITVLSPTGWSAGLASQVAYTFSDLDVSSGPHPIGLDQTGASNIGSQGNLSGDGNLYGVLVAGAAYVPTNLEIFAVQLHFTPES